LGCFYDEITKVLVVAERERFTITLPTISLLVLSHQPARLARAPNRDSPRICNLATGQAAYYSEQLGPVPQFRKMILKT